MNFSGSPAHLQIQMVAMAKLHGLRARLFPKLAQTQAECELLIHNLKSVCEIYKFDFDACLKEIIHLKMETGHTFSSACSQVHDNIVNSDGRSLTNHPPVFHMYRQGESYNANKRAEAIPTNDGTSGIYAEADRCRSERAKSLLTKKCRREFDMRVTTEKKARRSNSRFGK